MSSIRYINSKNSRKKIVLVGGCFDVLHYGHLVFLKKAKGQGDFLIVLLESDEFIKKYKKRSPIHTQNQRAEILSSVKYVDNVIKIPLLNSDEEYEIIVKKIKPTVIAVSEGDSQIENKTRQAESVGGKLIIVSNFIKGFSSKKIIKAFE